MITRRMTCLSDMIAAIILILLARLIAGSIESNLHEAFNDPDWMKIEETYGKDSD